MLVTEEQLRLFEYFLETDGLDFWSDWKKLKPFFLRDFPELLIYESALKKTAQARDFILHEASCYLTDLECNRGYGLYGGEKSIMGHINFSGTGVCEGVDERTKSDGTRYAVIEIGYALWGLPGKYFKAKLMCFAPAIYEALKIETFYRWEGVVTFMKGNTFLTITEVKDDEGNRIYTEPGEQQVANSLPEEEIP